MNNFAQKQCMITTAITTTRTKQAGGSLFFTALSSTLQNHKKMCHLKFFSKYTEIYGVRVIRIKIRPPILRRWRRSGIFIINFEQISHLVLVFLLLTLNMQLPTEYVTILFHLTALLRTAGNMR